MVQCLNRCSLMNDAPPFTHQFSFHIFLFFFNHRWRDAGDQWIQYDLGPSRQITGVVTRGHGGWESKRHASWITSYTMSYSNDTLLWFSYRDGNHLDAKVSLSLTPFNYCYYFYYYSVDDSTSTER